MIDVVYQPTSLGHHLAGDLGRNCPSSAQDQRSSERRVRFDATWIFAPLMLYRWRSFSMFCDFTFWLLNIIEHHDTLSRFSIKLTIIGMFWFSIKLAQMCPVCWIHQDMSDFQCIDATSSPWQNSCQRAPTLCCRLLENWANLWE